jgi:hypothetical protein
MFSAQKSLIAAALLSIVSLGTTVIDPQSAEAAVVVQTSATSGTLIADRNHDRDDYYDNDDRYERRSNNGRHRGQYRRNHRNGYYNNGYYNNGRAREIYSDSRRDPSVIISNPGSRYPRGHNCVRTLYATICN